MANDYSSIQVLQASVDPENESEFRILVDTKFVKYCSRPSPVGHLCAQHGEQGSLSALCVKKYDTLIV
jgi:hypothetical protein